MTPPIKHQPGSLNIICLDPVQLGQLEKSFREWVEETHRPDTRLSRKRIWIIFLLIRYTGARLNEVLALNPFEDIDYNRRIVSFGKTGDVKSLRKREVQLPESVFNEIWSALNDDAFKEFLTQMFRIDPGHVRRKFYERAISCGFSPAQGAPDVIRRARGVELIQGNVPLPVVQQIMGHSTPNLAASYVKFSDEDMRQLANYFIEKESRNKTSARNMFFGKVCAVRKGDIQSCVDVLTIGEYIITTVITNDSLERLCLKPGLLVTAEVKAPWIMLQKSADEPKCSAENKLMGTVIHIREGEITMEFVIRISDGTSLCAITTRETGSRLGILENDSVWAIFNSFAVILHVD
ncbi:MAG: TOBE domain-containing protein [Deltaproteobacteria bacterium]|nr:TOBE domain-containing protein [Deltaproteobacteria bacterium]